MYLFCINFPLPSFLAKPNLHLVLMQVHVSFLLIRYSYSKNLVAKHDLQVHGSQIIFLLLGKRERIEK
jgi:hypothetical protein